ncbi:MAG TPA: metallopeptidase TldD-related protein [Ktedonobacterales bacterium]|nr:metallopeptidase TldD-related protein [Ktedonobacterales bacterium]
MLRDDTMMANATASSLIGAVRATPGVDAWQVSTARREEAQVYLIGADIQEARRLVASDAAAVKLHNLHAPHTADGEGQALGETTLTILPDEQADASRLAGRLRDGALMASLTDNQPFSLPGMPAQGFPSVESEDLALGASIEAAVERAGQRLRAALRQTPGVRLGSAEIYATRTERSLTNSAGLSANTRETGAYLDLALLAGEGDNVAEFHAELQRRRLSDLHVERIVAAYGAFALHALHATAPDAWEGPVILSGDAVAGFFDSHFGGPLLAHASAEMAYQRMSRFKAGEYITGEEARGDRLTLASDATRPYGVRTAAYDGSGIPAQAVTLIEDGVFKRPWADARYAHYLGVPATGEIGNLTVNRGSTPLDTLRSALQGPVYEIVAFSLFNPDPVTGDFSTEIRLGYRHDASGVRPIKGGSLVGNIFAALTDAHFSAEPYTDGVYFGPAGIRFANLRITAG